MTSFTGPPSCSALTAERRRTELDTLPDARLDVLVIGGGITGAGVALDAASRGLSVALVEAHDLAFGTSRWSSKLVHGGLRYLASGDVALAYESARERACLMRTIAPHLIRPLPFLVPYGPATSRADRTKITIGRRVAEALRVAARTHPGTLPRARHVAPGEARHWAPAARPDLTGGTLFWDGQLEDDARLVVAVARTAAAFGARILTRVRALGLTGDDALLRDELTGAEVRVSARAVVNATGVWAGPLAGTTDSGDPVAPLRPSKGTHILLRSSILGNPPAALMMPVPDASNRFVFALPQPDGLVICGLTDDPVDAVNDVPAADPSEIDFLLGTLSHWLARPVDPSAVVGSFAGLRPLVAPLRDDAAERTSDLSRHHLVARSTNGVVTVVGGKLTTYRRMAEDTVNVLDLTDRRCETRRLPLVGAPGDPTSTNASSPRLIRRYGAEAAAVAALAEADPDLAAPVAPGLSVLGVEVAWALLVEGALDTADVLERRTRLALVPADAHAAADAVARIVERYASPAGAVRLTV